MRLRRRLRKRYKRTRRHDHWIVINVSVANFKVAGEEYFNYVLQNADPQKKGNFNLWRATKALKQQPHIQYTLKNHNGQWCQTVEEQAEAFAIDLERRFRPFDTASAAHCRRVESLLDRQIDLPDSTRIHHHLRHVTLEELKSYIDQLLMLHSSRSSFSPPPLSELSDLVTPPSSMSINSLVVVADSSDDVISISSDSGSIYSTLKSGSPIYFSSILAKMIDLGDINIASCYWPPKGDFSTELYESFFSYIGTKCIIGADWNAKHRQLGNVRACPRGITLRNFILSSNALNILTTAEPTHFPANGNTPSVLDFCVFAGISIQRLTIKRLLNLGSDHLPLIVDLRAMLLGADYYYGQCHQKSLESEHSSFTQSVQT
ncbi:hypothetical protein ACLKA6_012798 [Drosophila palustris]